MPIDRDEYRKASHDVWERIATNWDSEREYIYSATGPVSRRMVERVAPEPGDTVLDLAAGTGDTGFLTAAMIGDEGKLISTDFASAMVEAARGVGARLGLENVEYRVLDAEHMDLDDSSVDRVLCRFGYMLMADPATALGETRRVLRDDGRVCLAVWTTPEENLWAFVSGAVLVERGHLPPPEPGAPGIFAMGDPERIRELVTGAGLRGARDRAAGDRVAVRARGRALGLHSQARGAARRCDRSAGRERARVRESRRPLTDRAADRERPGPGTRPRGDDRLVRRLYRTGQAVIEHDAADADAEPLLEPEVRRSR